LFDVNVFSIITLVQIALPYLRKSDKGSIIIVSSGAALKGYQGWGAYGA
jgi:NAD(P)-dependent dehydrogenase (short-subunit alcohol dehydrogenase family)